MAAGSTFKPYSSNQKAPSKSASGFACLSGEHSQLHLLLRFAVLAMTLLLVLPGAVCAAVGLAHHQPQQQRHLQHLYLCAVTAAGVQDQQQL
jgi:hypothetical protein